jgi:acyl-CoA synthetase (NDP forming)
VSLCLLDYPREDRCDQSTWGGAERGFVRAVQQTGTKGAVLSTFSDTVSETVAARLMKDGIAMLAGIDAGLTGIQAAVDVGAAWNKSPSPPLLSISSQGQVDPTKVLDEAQSKDFLHQRGLPVPPGRVVRSASEAAEAAQALGYPVVVKALGITHKTEVRGVKLGLASADDVSGAVKEISELSDSYLVEKMIEGVVAELILGVAQDEQFGPYLLIGGGGTLVEMMRDSVSVLMPTTRERVLDALGQLKCAPLFSGFRGAPPVDLNAAVDVILTVASMIEEDPASIIELDINPLMLLAEGQGVVVADALISLSANPRNNPGEGNPNE